jgi:hypothetical protein
MFRPSFPGAAPPIRPSSLIDRQNINQGITGSQLNNPNIRRRSPFNRAA